MAVTGTTTSQADTTTIPASSKALRATYRETFGTANVLIHEILKDGIVDIRIKYDGAHIHAENKGSTPTLVFLKKRKGIEYSVLDGGKTFNSTKSFGEKQQFYVLSRDAGKLLHDIVAAMAGKGFYDKHDEIVEVNKKLMGLDKDLERLNESQAKAEIDYQSKKDKYGDPDYKDTLRDHYLKETAKAVHGLEKEIEALNEKIGTVEDKGDVQEKIKVLEAKIGTTEDPGPMRMEGQKKIANVLDEIKENWKKAEEEYTTTLEGTSQYRAKLEGEKTDLETEVEGLKREVVVLEKKAAAKDNTYGEIINNLKRVFGGHGKPDKKARRAEKYLSSLVNKLFKLREENLKDKFKKFTGEEEPTDYLENKSIEVYSYTLETGIKRATWPGVAIGALIIGAAATYMLTDYLSPTTRILNKDITELKETTTAMGDTIRTLKIELKTNPQNLELEKEKARLETENEGLENRLAETEKERDEAEAEIEGAKETAMTEKIKREQAIEQAEEQVRDLLEEARKAAPRERYLLWEIGKGVSRVSVPEGGSK